MKPIKYLFSWKYRYFLSKLRGVYKMIADMEFKRFKTAELYDEVSQERDSLKSRLSVLSAKIESEKNNPTMEKGDIARLDDDKVRLEKQIENTEAQMKDMDLEMHGCGKCAEYPSGLQGADQTIDALQELVGMLKNYIKSL
jgi:hypothetical protein